MGTKRADGFTDGTDPASSGRSSAQPSPPGTARSVGEIESFITLLRVACEDATVNARLEKLLSLPDDRRRALVHTWVADMVIGQAPKDLIAAIGCLYDDHVAEKAYEVIYKCRRGAPREG